MDTGSTKEVVNIRGIEFAKNFGQPSAQLAGHAVSKGDVIVDMDDYGQTPINQRFCICLDCFYKTFSRYDIGNGLLMLSGIILITLGIVGEYTVCRST